MFIIPNRADKLQASEAKVLINVFKVVVSYILNGIQNAAFIDARAQADEDVETLMRTRSCMGCDLSHLDLSEDNLAGADLSSSNLTGVILKEANLDEANLSEATWCDGNFICGTSSIGTFVGCASIDNCTGR